MKYILASLLLVGCATTGTTGPTSIGPDQYMIGGLGKFTDFSGSVVKARFLQQAAEFCLSQGKIMQLMNSKGADSGPGTYATAEIQFRCI